MHLSSPGTKTLHKSMVFCHERRDGELKSRNGGTWGPGVGQHAHVLVHIPVGSGLAAAGALDSWEWEEAGTSRSVLPHADKWQRLDCNCYSPACAKGRALLPCPTSCSGIRVCSVTLVHLL